MRGRYSFHSASPSSLVSIGHAGTVTCGSGATGHTVRGCERRGRQWRGRRWRQGRGRRGRGRRRRPRRRPGGEGGGGNGGGDSGGGARQVNAVGEVCTEVWWCIPSSRKHCSPWSGHRGTPQAVAGHGSTLDGRTRPLMLFSLGLLGSRARGSSACRTAGGRTRAACRVSRTPHGTGSPWRTYRKSTARRPPCRTPGATLRAAGASPARSHA